MVRIRTRIHDKFSLEFKIWYENEGVQGGSKPEHFRLESWIFLPATLDVNALTYSREQFYSDITNYYRTITPVFVLGEVASCSADTGVVSVVPNANYPFDYLSNAIYNIVNYPNRANLSEYEYQIKMFCAIFKSAMREQYNLIKEQGAQCKDLQREEQEVALFIKYSRQILKTFAALGESHKGRVEEDVYKYFSFGEEFIINLSELYFYKLDKNILSANMVSSFLMELGAHKKERGYGVLTRGSGRDNARLLYRWNVLKKYVESDLFLSIDKRKSGVLKEQIWYSIAAGLAMVFATAVSFAFQQKYGNFTMPLFVALVVSYMLKDRIKELVRSVFSSNRKLKYFDNKTLFSVKDSVVGRSREGFDIIPQAEVPQEILRMRNRSLILDVENSINQEDVLFYRNLIELDANKLAATSEYKTSGINEILFLNLSSFIKKMDNPHYVHNICSDSGVEEIVVDKVYYLNFIFQISYGNNTLRQRYRVTMNRNGIVELETL